MKILITGGLGYLGSYIAKYFLEKSYEVFIITRSLKGTFRFSANELNKIKIIEKDIKDITDEVKDMNVIIHTAGRSRSSLENLDDKLEDSDYEINGKLTLKLLNSIKTYNPNAKFVYLSSIQIYGNKNKLPASESDLPEPISISAATKLIGEHYCKIFSHLFNIHTCIARITNIYGYFESDGNERLLINYLTRKAILEEDLTIFQSSKQFKKDFLHASDLASAIYNIAINGKSNEIYNVSSNQAVSIEEIFELISRLSNHYKIHEIENKNISFKLSIKSFWANNEKLIKLGWKPKIDLENGIKLLINQYKKEILTK